MAIDANKKTDGDTVIVPADGAKEPSVAELRTQIENLNKGIAGYRDEARNASESAKKEASTQIKKLQDELKDLKGKKTKDDEDDLELSKEDEKRLQAWATKNGFASKKDLEEQKVRLFQESQSSIQTQAVSEFIQKHPIYEKKEEWDKVLVEYAQFRTPSTLDGYKKLLARIHKDLNGGKDDEDAKALGRAEEITRGRLSLSRGSQPYNGENETVESLQKRYPRLGKELIEARLAELKSLYAKKDKK